MYNLPQHEFEQLKEFFDKNNCYEGTTLLSKILEDAIQSSFKPDSYGYNYSVPLVACEGLKIDAGNSLETPGISLDPALLQELDHMANELKALRATVNNLESMHNPESTIDHVPTIISTKEQYEELKPKTDAADRVLVHTTFDKALTAL